MTQRNNSGYTTATSSRALWQSAVTAIGTIWGFISSDFLTFAVPNTLFGLVGALPGTGLTKHDLHLPHRLLHHASRVLFFNFYSLLLFDLSNQHWPESVREDSVNKPWRPIPSGRITSQQTRRLVLFLAPTALWLNYILGVWSQGLLVQVLSWYYNDIRGCDEVFRDAIIAVSYGLANATSLLLAAVRPDSEVNVLMASVITPRGYRWTAIISGVILTTMHVQDLKDQEGDRRRNRKTIPLMFGDRASRLVISALVPFWSVVCVAFWHQPLEDARGDADVGGSRGYQYLHMARYSLQLLLGILVAWRVVSKQSARDDAKTWRLWCCWHSSLYVLPLISTANWTT